TLGPLVTRESSPGPEWLGELPRLRYRSELAATVRQLACISPCVCSSSLVETERGRGYGMTTLAPDRAGPATGPAIGPIVEPAAGPQTPDRAQEPAAGPARSAGS